LIIKLFVFLVIKEKEKKQKNEKNIGKVLVEKKS